MLKQLIQKWFVKTAEKESVKHNWEVKGNWLTQDHKQRVFAYTCRDCFKNRVLTESDILDNADSAYKNEIENSPVH